MSPPLRMGLPVIGSVVGLGLMPVIVRVDVLVSVMPPLVVLLEAVKLPTVFAPVSVVPVTELVVSKPVVLIRPRPVSVIEPPFSVRLTAPPPVAVIVPVMLMLPVLVTVTLPPPELLMPVTFNGLATLVSSTLPLPVLMTLNPVTVFALFNMVPPAELVVSIMVLMEPVWVMVPAVAARLTVGAERLAMARLFET